MKIIAILISALFCISCSNQYYRSAEGTKALSKQRDFVGSWTGEGKSYDAANQKGKSWTATAHYSLGYGGNLVQKKETINIDSAPEKASLSFIGWDYEHQNSVILSVANDGKGAMKEPMSLINDNQFLHIRTRKNDKRQTVVDKTTTELFKNHYTVLQHRSINGAAEFVSFEGQFKRDPDVNATSVDLSAVKPLVPTSNETKTIACMAGIYRQQGNYHGSPIDGDETIDLILGGHAMFINFKFKADAGDGYFGSSLTSWDAEKGHFTGFMISNDAMTAPFKAWLSEDKTKLIYEPTTLDGKSHEDERWHADINPQQKDHCLSGVVSDGLLQIVFTKK